MKIIDAHSHTEFRSANDYWNMSLTGINTIINPSTYSGFIKRDKEVYHTYFNRLLNFECKRAQQNNIKLLIGVGIDPEDFWDINVALEVIEEIPERYFEHPNLCCLGEIGLDKGGSDEELILKKQLEIVGKYKIPAIIHTPQVNQIEVTSKTVEIVDSFLINYPHIKEYLVLDELLPENLKLFANTGFAFYGIPVGPELDTPYVIHKKANVTSLLGMLKENKIDNLLFSSALAWGCGDALALSKIKLGLELNGVQEDLINKFFYQNALNFFSKWKDIE